MSVEFVGLKISICYVNNAFNLIPNLEITYSNYYTIIHIPIPCRVVPHLSFWSLKLPRFRNRTVIRLDHLYKYHEFSH